MAKVRIVRRPPLPSPWNSSTAYIYDVDERLEMLSPIDGSVVAYYWSFVEEFTDLDDATSYAEAIAKDRLVIKECEG